MRKSFLRLGSLMAMLAVILGAFGAHSLENLLAPEQLDTFETGVRYQFYHAFGLLAIGLLLYWRKNNLLLVAGWLFLAGIILFSGSLYALSLAGALEIDLSGFGIITPIGGFGFIGGWACLIFATFSKNEKNYKRKSTAGREDGV